MCFFGVGFFFLAILVIWPAIFFLFAVLAKAAKQDWLQHHVLDPQLVVTQSGPDPATSRRAAPGLMPSN